MPISIQPYVSDHEKLVVEFNRRLKSGGESFQFPESSEPFWLPRKEDRRLFQEYYLAIEDSTMVRGGYILKHQDFVLDRKIISVGNYQLPISEGIINRDYNMLGVRLLNDALSRQPLLYALGMGSMQRPLPKLLTALGWRLVDVPFYFRIIHRFRFLRNIQHLRKTRFRRLALDLLAFSGLGWLAIKGYLSTRTRIHREDSDIAVAEVDSFDGWADELWEAAARTYLLSAVRDSATLNVLYPSGDSKFLKLKLVKDSAVVGWVVLLDTQMAMHKQFGDMRVGTIVDCLTQPGMESSLMALASQYLIHRGVDLIVSNQAARAYGEALRSQGFLAGPSNFIFAASPQLAGRLGKIELAVSRCHINRGDGDGPIHL